MNQFKKAAALLVSAAMAASVLTVGVFAAPSQNEQPPAGDNPNMMEGMGDMPEMPEGMGGGGSVVPEGYEDKAITLDGVAMGQVQRLETVASLVYEGGELDEALSTQDGLSQTEDGTDLAVTGNDVNGIVIRNTGSFVLGGDSDPALVAEKLNYSYITGEYYPDWDAFCQALGYDASKSIEEIAQDLVDNGSTGSYTNLGLDAPETVALSDFTIRAAGSGSNDMGGFGAAVYVSDNADAQLDNFHVVTYGPGRGTLFTRFGATVEVNNSTFYAVSDPDIQTMQGCPPGLFLEGKVRATNAVGASKVTYHDSVVISQGWGALSTDSDDLYTVADNPTVVTAENSYIGVLTSGYGSYSDGNAQNIFKGSAIDVPDYGAVQTGGGVVSYTDCVINAGEYGVMTHSGNSRGTISFENTELHVGEAGVMLRDTANTVTFIHSTIAFDGTYTIDPDLAARYGVDMDEVDETFGTTDGVDAAYTHTVFSAEDSNCIVKLIHNSDGGSGTESTGAAPTVLIQDSEMAGDILNTAAMEGDENTATSGPAGEGVRTARSLDVTLDNSAVTGSISLGQDTWTVTHFASGDNDSQDIGYASSTELGAFHDDGYGLSLTLQNGATWTLGAYDCYLTSLTVGEGCAIVNMGGVPVSVTVDGAAVELVPGTTYAGDIVVSPAPSAVDSAPVIETTGVNPDESGTALARTRSVLVDGKEVEFQMYALAAENGDETHYIKLRDLADILDGTAAQFNVTFDGGVTLTSGAAYTDRNGQEGQAPYSGDQAYEKYTGTVTVDGVSLALQAFVIADDTGGGSTYFKLRDLGQALGFNVGFSDEQGKMFVESDKAYDPAD